MDITDSRQESNIVLGAYPLRWRYAIKAHMQLTAMGGCNGLLYIPLQKSPNVFQARL